MKTKLTVKFLLPVILLLVALTVILSLIVTSVLRESMLRRASTFVADFVQLQAKNHISDPSVFLTIDRNSQLVFSKVQSEVKTSEVARIKVWNTNKTVIYSDDSSLVGKTFTDNIELNEALRGNIKTEIVNPTKEENIDERNYQQLMEIYVPIYFSNKSTPVGVIETYYTLDTLNSEIAQVQTRVVVIILVAFLVLASLLWLLLHFLVIHPVQKLENATKEIAKGNFDHKILVSSQDELGSLGESFNRMGEGLKRLQELRNEFVFIGAHELRTPVTAINGYISLLFSSEDIKNLSGNSRKFLDAIKMLNQRLNQLVNDILEIARNDAGKIDIKVQPVNIEQVILGIIEETKPLSDQKKITVSYSQPSREVKVLADEGKLKEIVMNLISNAIKYGTAGGYVNINHELSSEIMTTNIINNGVGIPKAEQSNIFGKFFRAQNVKTADYQGTGLGLFITKELIDKMKGRIWFNSIEGKETTFSFSLPVSKA